MGLLGEDIDPKTQGLLALGFGLLNSRGNLGQAIGQAGPQAMQAYSQANDAIQRKKQQEQAMQAQALQMQMSQQQMAEMQRQAALAEAQRAKDDEFRKLIPSPQGQAASAALAGGGGPTVGNAAAMPKVDPFNQQLFEAMRLGQIKPMDYLTATKKDNAPIKLAAGEGLYQPGTYKPLVLNPKEDATPKEWTLYQLSGAPERGISFDQWDLTRKKAGATNIGMPKIEIKMGESVAGQVGPMVKDSKVQVQGAVGMFDSADRIQKALDSGKVSTGPFTTQIQTVKQLIQKVGGGSDDGIRQTRQVIKGLAQMSVEARKELQGQGQVTDSESAAVAKAESGDINDLTTGELQDLVTLTKRAAHYRAKNHQSLLDSMSAQDATKGSVPFYKVQGLDRLLNHSPQLPQIGGGGAVDDALKKYGGK